MTHRGNWLGVLQEKEKSQEVKKARIFKSEGRGRLRGENWQSKPRREGERHRLGRKKTGKKRSNERGERGKAREKNHEKQGREL